MPAIYRLVLRDDSSMHPALTPTMTSMLIALVTLIIIGVFLVGALFLIRSHKVSKQKLQSLQSDPDSPSQSHYQFHTVNSSKNSNHRRLTITASPYGRRSESVYLYGGSEKRSLVSGPSSPPHSPIPEIRITFPEEEDGFGKRKSGRVVIVRISDAGGVGLEPYHDDGEHLPPYQTARDGKFESLDLERMGGLKEVERGVHKQ